MIKVTEVVLNPNTMTAEVSLFADTKAEVGTTAVSDISGMPEGYTIAQASSVITASGELAFMKSDGTWNWLS